MKLLVKPAHCNLPAHTRTPLDLLVRAVAPALPPDHRRPALRLLPLLDVSASMGGLKLAAAKHAIGCLIEHLVPGDEIGLATFSDRAVLVSELREASAAGKEELLRELSCIGPESRTNLGGGFLLAFETLRAEQARGLSRARVIILTDGLCNHGPAQSAQGLLELVGGRPNGVSVSCFGYGEDCDHVLLSQLSTAGQGSFAFVANEDAVLTAFARELGGLVSTYASSLVLRVRTAAGDGAELPVGDLLDHGELARVMSVDVSTHACGKDVEIARLEASWKDARGLTQTTSVPIRMDIVSTDERSKAYDKDVLRHREESELSQAIQHAEELARSGDLAVAKGMLVKVLKSLKSRELRRLLKQQILPSYDSPAGCAAMASRRGTAVSVLSGSRTLVADESLPASQANEAEQDMIERFRRS